MDNMTRFVPVILLSAAMMMACKEIVYTGPCGTYAETGTIFCYFYEEGPPSMWMLCASHPMTIRTPGVINSCIDAETGAELCKPCGAWTFEMITSYVCDGCSIVSTGSTPSGVRCCTATLEGTCP